MKNSVDAQTQPLDFLAAGYLLVCSMNKFSVMMRGKKKDVDELPIGDNCFSQPRMESESVRRFLRDCRWGYENGKMKKTACSRATHFPRPITDDVMSTFRDEA
jgi:hypothetical protein